MDYGNWMDKPLLDDSQIKMLSEADDGDFALLTELKEIHVNETEPLIKELKLAIQQEDGSQIIRKAHAIAGSSANLGLMRFSYLMRHIEYDNIDSAEMPELLEQMDALYQHSLSALDEVING